MDEYRENCRDANTNRSWPQRFWENNEQLYVQYVWGIVPPPSSAITEGPVSGGVGRERRDFELECIDAFTWVNLFYLCL